MAPSWSTTNNSTGGFKVSGLKGMSTWCAICEYMTDHNTLYHQDIINLHRESSK